MNLSILVSVYNQKPEYLKRCVDSLPREAEIIIIDDGSITVSAARKPLPLGMGEEAPLPYIEKQIII